MRQGRSKTARAVFAAFGKACETLPQQKIACNMQGWTEMKNTLHATRVPPRRQCNPIAQHNSMPPLSDGRRFGQHNDMASDDEVHKQHTAPHTNPNDVFKH